MVEPQRLNVLFIASWFPSRKRPTDGNFIQRHAEAVATLNNVSVLHIITDEEVPSGMIEWDIRTEKGVDIHIGYIGQRRNPIMRWRDYFRAYKKGWQALQSPDIIHLNVLFPAGLFARYFSRKYNVPLIATEHWTGYHENNRRQTSALVWRLHRLIARSASTICPVSADLKKSMIECGLKGDYQVVPNVVNTKVFSPSGQRKEPSSTRTLLHVSTLIDHHKNVTGILESFKDLVDERLDIKLQIVGDGDLEPHRITAKKLDIPEEHISFHGTQTPEGIAQFMQEADIFLLFSQYENLPCVILESFATGTPVVSSAVGGIAEHFPESGGRLVKKGNKEEFKEAIRTVLATEPAQRDDLVTYARQHFSEEQIAKQFDQIYRRALS